MSATERQEPPLTPDSSIKPIAGNFLGKDIVSLEQFDHESLNNLFQEAHEMRKWEYRETVHPYLNGKHIVLLFYEPSSRTFGSFDSAVHHLGGTTTAILDPKTFSSVSKGETFQDTIRTFEGYSDLIVMRHPEVGKAKEAAEIASVPIINAGDGIGEHPTQALLDLFTIWEHAGRLDDLTGAIAGDVLNGRTIHSLLDGLSMYANNTIYLLSPDELSLSEEQIERYRHKGLSITAGDRPEDIPSDADFWYWTRTQKERFANTEDYEALKNKYVVTPEFLEQYGNPDLILMHPLPRVGEITEDVDSDPRAIYFEQAQNGLYIRMALLKLILKG